MRNIFCTVDNLGFPHFTAIDLMRYKLLPNNQKYLTGRNYLWAYKAAFLVYHRELIIRKAHDNNIPALLLAGVAVAEVGGKPDRLKGYGVLQLRQLIDIFSGNNILSNATSVGSVAIQLRAAAEALVIDPSQLTRKQQFQLSSCLLNDEFNISVTAKHLNDLILFDYPDADTRNLTDEQIILAGSRYNRGTQRTKQDFIDSLTSPEDSPSRTYTEYGRSIVNKKESIINIMELGR